MCDYTESELLAPPVDPTEADEEFVRDHYKNQNITIKVIYSVATDTMPGFGCLDWAVARVGGTTPEERSGESGFTDVTGHSPEELAKEYFPKLTACENIKDVKATVAILAKGIGGKATHVQYRANGLARWESKLSTDALVITHGLEDLTHSGEFGQVILCLK